MIPQYLTDQMHQAEAVFLYAHDSYHKLAYDKDSLAADKVLKYKLLTDLVMSQGMLADIYKLISEIYTHERAEQG